MKKAIWKFGNYVSGKGKKLLRDGKIVAYLSDDGWLDIAGLFHGRGDYHVHPTNYYEVKP